MARSLRTGPILSLVIPIHKESENVALLIARIRHVLGGNSYEMLFVNDSDDETPSTIAYELTLDPSIRVIHPIKDERSGVVISAIVAAIRQANGKFISIMSNELHHSPELLPQLLIAAEDADIVVASRYIPGGSEGASSVQSQCISRGSKLAAAALFARVRACSDPLSGLFLFRREVVANVNLRPLEAKLLLEILVRGHWSHLTEVPYLFKERQNSEGKISIQRGNDYLRHLRELRLEGKGERGPVRYRRLRVPVGPDDPQPLDDDLSEMRELAGHRRRKLLWTIAALALVLRFILLPIGHWWDLTVDYNVFIDLAHNHSPYDTMRYLSHIAVSSGWDYDYEYYAYPPIPFYFYWPLAHIFFWLHPGATYYIPVSGSFAMPNLPIDFYFFQKFPVWIADFLIASLLARMSGTIRGWRDYLLNPYVLLISGAWTFDAVMVLGLVAGAYWLQQEKFARSGIALAFGTMVKFIPALAVPTFVLFLIKKKRSPREIIVFLASYGIACLVFVGPFLKGLVYVVSFHSGRIGGGMNWQMFWRLYTLFPKGADLDPTSLAIGSFGTITLAIVLLLAYRYMYLSPMRLNRMIIVTLLAFFIGSKLVNEQYALVILPFAFLEARQVGGAWRWLYRLLWIVPFTFAIMRVPIDRFLWLFYHTLLGSRANAITTTGVTGFQSAFIPWSNLRFDQVSVAILGVGFTLLCIIAILWPVRAMRRPYQHHYVSSTSIIEKPSLPTPAGHLPNPPEQRGPDESGLQPRPEVALQR